MAGQIQAQRMPQREMRYPRAPILSEDSNQPSQADHSNHANQSGDLAKLAAKLLKVMAACANVPKDKQNPQQHYQYASSDAVLAKANPAFVAAGLATVCNLEILDRQPRTTNSGGMWELVTVRARISIIDTETGASIETDGIGQGYDGADKALSKAQTQARKYALLLALNISTGEDPEGDGKTDAAQVSPVPCKRCKGPAAYIDDCEFEGKCIHRYFCEKCKVETRKEA